MPPLIHMRRKRRESAVRKRSRRLQHPACFSASLLIGWRIRFTQLTNAGFGA